TATDLESYTVQKSRSIEIPYRDFVVLLPGGCSTGGVLTAFSLKLLDAFPLSQWLHGSTPHLRLLYEVMSATTSARPQWDHLNATLPLDQAIAAFLDDACIEPYQRAV